MFENIKLTTYQKEILLACEVDELLLKVKEENKEEYKFICKAMDYCWKWIERRQVPLCDMLDIIEAEDGYDISYCVKECKRDAKKQEIYDEFFNVVLYIGGKAIDYEGYSIPFYLDEIFYDPEYWDKIVNNMIKIDINLEKKWTKVLNFYDKERENISRSIKWIKKSLDEVEPTFLEENERYSSIQKEVLILYVANELIKELEGDEGYKCCYEGLQICLEWIKYREANYEKIEKIEKIVKNNNNCDINYYTIKEKNSRKKKIYQLILKIFKFELLRIIFYEDCDMIEYLYDVRDNLNYWEELIEEIIEFDNDWKEKLGKVFTIFLQERKIEYGQTFSLRETLRKL